MSELGELGRIRDELKDIKMTLRELVDAIKQLNRTVTIELPFEIVDEEDDDE